MDGMNKDWLQQLAPAHALPEPGMWPLAPGWWAVLVLLLLFAALYGYWYRRPVLRMRRLAIRELEILQRHTHEDTQLAASLQDLMRRYAIAVYGRETVASLAGEEWLAFIVTHGGTELTGETGQSLLRAAYGSHMLGERAAWLRGVHGFLRGRR